MSKPPHGTLAHKLLFAITLLFLGLTLIGNFAAFVIFRDHSQQERMADFSLYVREHTRTEQALFETLEDRNALATRELSVRLANMDTADAAKAFDRFFPLRPDGTRRSTPALYSGRADGDDGDFIFGIGAFIANGRALTAEDKRLLLAAMRVVAENGAAGRGRLDNFYFVQPQNRLVMFGPDRSDRLRYYRKTAPANLDFSREEMARITLPANDPQRVTRCTGLRRLLSDPASPMTIACLTPVYVNGRYVGAWGSTIPTGAYLTQAINDTPAGATTLIVSGKGDLIAYPGFTRPGAASGQTAAWLKKGLDFQDLMVRIKAQHRSSGVIANSAAHNLVAYGHIDGPDWWFLITTPDSQVTWTAIQSVSVILVLKLVAMMLVVALFYFILRRLVLTPLERLAQHSNRDGGPRETCDLGDLATRSDEIGTLARVLAAERSRSKELLASLEERVRERTAELERANEAKSRFLANMSHELRTPLNGVIALSDALARRQEDPEAREMANLVVSSGRLLEQVLTDILDISKIDAGEMTLEAVELDLETLVSRIAELHRASAADKGLTFNWRVAPDARGRYLGDPVRITQILSNLLSNAVKFTTSGSVTLEAIRGDDGGLRLGVTDTGIGFDESVRARLFNRFMQADASTTRRFGGSGLGLAICASLIDLMGGTISVESEPGKGTRFEVRLPLQQAQAAAAPAADVEIEPGSALEGLEVLLAEDHPTNQRIVQLLLGPTGAAVTIAENGAQALDLLAAKRFDVVLMDMQMPVMDGLQAVAELRGREAEQNLPRTPVIMLTANAMGEHVEAARRAGADQHMAKPLRAEALIRAVAACAFQDSGGEEPASAA